MLILKGKFPDLNKTPSIYYVFYGSKIKLIKKESPISYEDITTSIRKAITKLKETHLKNYFIHVFRAEWLKKDRKTRKRPKKEYLD
jgi:hypothetical protein